MRTLTDWLEEWYGLGRESLTQVRSVAVTCNSMEFTPAVLTVCASASAAAWLVRRKWVHVRHEMAHDFYVAAHALFEDGTFEARLMTEEDGTIVAVNESAADLFRWRASDLTRINVQKLIIQGQPEVPLAALVQRYRRQQELYRTCLEMEGQRKDGSVFPMELRFSDIRLGKDMFILITARDLTQTKINKRWEQELELASGTLQFVGYPIFVLDGEGKIVKHNTALEDYTGFSADELRQAPYAERLLAPEDRKRATASILDLLLQGESHSEEASWKLKDGSHAEVVLVMRRLEAVNGGSRFAVIAAMPARTATPTQTEALPSIAELESPPEPEFLAKAPEPPPPPAPPKREIPPFDRSRDEYPPPLTRSAPKTPEPIPIQPFAPVTPLMDRPAPLFAAPSFTLNDPPKRISHMEARQMEADYHALAEEFGIPERQSPVFREINLNEHLRRRKPGLARMLGGRARLTSTFDLELDSVLGDPALIDEVCLTLVWIGRHGMPTGGKVSLTTSAVNLDRIEARSLGGLRGGSYAVLGLRYQPSSPDSELHALLFTPFHESSAGATLQATLPGLHALLRSNGANLLVEQAPDNGALVRVFLPMARLNTRSARAGGLQGF